ncbi:TIGR03943 family protein [Clostridium sp. CTA-7]
MRKFNVDEFIWLLILILLTIFIAYLMTSGDVYKFLSPKTAKNLYVALGILPILIIVQLFKVITFNSRVDRSISYLPIIFTLMIGVIIIFNNSILNNDLEIDEYKFKSNGINDSLEISYENHHIIDEINENGIDFLGENIVFTGFVHKYNDENKFILAREEMNCCVADSVIIGLNSFCQDNLKEGQWIKALGKIEYNGEYYFNIIEYIKVNPPDNQYF